jgi:hypothetical protein
MRIKSFALGIGFLAAATGIVAAARPTTVAPDVMVPGVVVVATDNLRHSRDLRSALLSYNGCVRGTNTPDCYLYAARVYRLTRRTDVN